MYVFAFRRPLVGPLLRRVCCVAASPPPRSMSWATNLIAAGVAAVVPIRMQSLRLYEYVSEAAAHTFIYLFFITILICFSLSLFVVVNVVCCCYSYLSDKFFALP